MRRKMIMMSVLAAGSVLIAGTPAFAHDDATTTTTSTTVKAGTSYDDNWYHDYYCWVITQYGNDWHLDDSYKCDNSGGGSTTTTSTAVAPTTTTTVHATTTAAPTTSTTEHATTTTAAPVTTTVAPTTTTVAPTTDVVVSLLTPVSASVAAHSNSWITLNWTVLGGNADVFHVTATADKGVSATYPENTGTYTSLYRDDQLANLELDYTAVKLDVPAGVTGNVTLTLHLTYHTAQGNKDKNYTVTVPVAGS